MPDGNELPTEVGLETDTSIVDRGTAAVGSPLYAWSQAEALPEVVPGYRRISWRWIVVVLALLLTIGVIGVEAGWYEKRGRPSHEVSQPLPAPSTKELPPPPLHPTLNGSYMTTMAESRATYPHGDPTYWSSYQHDDVEYSSVWRSDCNSLRCVQEMGFGDGWIGFTWDNGSWVNSRQGDVDENGIGSIEKMTVSPVVGSATWSGTVDFVIDRTVPGGPPIGSETITPIMLRPQAGFSQ